MKRKILFGLIFLLCSGWLNAHPTASSFESSELASNMELSIPPDSLPWQYGFEPCWVAGAYNTGDCGKFNNYNKNPLDITKTSTQIIPQEYPNATVATAANNAMYMRSKSGRVFLQITPRADYTGSWPAWAFTPVFELKQGKTYTFSFWYIGNTSTELYTNGAAILVKGGEVADVGGDNGIPSEGLMNITFDSITPTEARYRQCKVSYTPTKDVSFSFALCCKNKLATAGTVNPVIIVDDLELAELPGSPEPKEPTVKAKIGAIDVQWSKPLNSQPTSYALDYKKTGEASYTTRYTTNTTWNLTGLDEAKEYTIGVRAIYGTDTSLRSPEVPIVTNATPDTVFPFTENFEDAESYSKWVFVHHGHAQYWTIGDSANKSGTGRGSLYSISSKIGTRPSTLSYQGSANGINGQSAIYAYRDIKFPEGDGFKIKLNYRFATSAAASYWGAVYLVDTSFVLKEGTAIPTEFLLKQYTTNATNWTADEIPLDPDECSGKTKRLVFAWIMKAANIYTTTVLPLAIDNIQVVTACPLVKDFTFAGFEGTKIKASWNAPEQVPNFEVQYKPTSTSTWTIPSTIIAAKNYTYNTNNDTLYDIRVRSYCDATNQSTWVQISNILTPQQTPKIVPFVETFGSGNGWRALNGTGIRDKWYTAIDTANSNETNYSAFISFDSIGGKTHRYYNRNGYGTTIHLYRDVTFPAASGRDFLLSFDWTAWGDPDAYRTDPNADYLIVSMVDIEDTACKPTVGVKLPKGTLENYWGRDTLKPMANAQFILPAADYAGKTKRLVFSWINDGSNKGNATYPQPQKPPSAAINNLSIDTLSCTPPHYIVAQSPTHDSIHLTWITTTTNVTLKYRASDATQGPDDNWKSVTVTNQCKLGNLLSNKLYEFSLQTNSCGKPYDTAFTVHTLQVPVSLVDDYYEDFATSSSESHWTPLYPSVALNHDRWIRGTKADEEGSNNYSVYINSTVQDIIDVYGIDNNVCSFFTFDSYYYFYREFNIPDNAKELAISFDWKYPGSPSYSNLSVYVTDLNTPLLFNTPPQEGNMLGNKTFGSSSAWKTENFFTPVDQGSKTKRLVFVWKSSKAIQWSQAVAIDNIKVIPYTTLTPADLTVTAVLPKSLKVEWESSVDSSFIVAYRKENTQQWDYDTVKVNVATSPKTDMLNLNSPNTYYQIMVKANKSGAGWTLPVTGLTPQTAADADGFEEKFEEVEKYNQWTFVQDEQKNRWYRGNFGRNKPEDSCLYIDMDGGTTNFYDVQKSISHVYRDIEFGNNDYYTLSYDWKGVGNSGKDYLRVFVVDPTDYPIAGSSLPSHTVIDNRYGSIDWMSATVNFPTSVKGMRKRIVFSWENAGTSAVAQQPTSIDNIRIGGLNCPPPKDLKLVGQAYYDSIRISWSANTDHGFLVRHRAIGESAWITSNTIAEKTLCIQGLNQNTTYEIQVQAVCETSGSSAWSSSFPATTNLEPKTLPFVENFEGQVPAFKLVNGIQNNRWVMGAIANAEEGKSGKSLYVSPDGGAHYTYAMSKSVVHFYRDISLPTVAAEYALSFDWKANGWSTDYMTVYLTDTSTAVTAGTLVSAAARIGKSSYWDNQQITPFYRGDTIFFPTDTTLKGKTKRLVFTWSNVVSNWSGGIPPNPPAAVDNIKFVPLSCLTPTNLKAAYPESGKAELSWSANSDTKFTVYYRTKGETSWTIKPDQPNPALLTGLEGNTTYEFQVLNNCPATTATDTNNYRSAIGIFNTLQTPASLPFDEDFQNSTKVAQWSFIDGLNRWVIAASNKISDENARYLYVTYQNSGYNAWLCSVGNPNKYVYAFRDIDFTPNTAEGFKISFEWLNQGSILNGVIEGPGSGKAPSDRDNFQIFLVDRELVLDPTKDIPQEYLLSERKFCSPELDKALTDSIYIPNTVSGIKRLVFRWVDSMHWTNFTVMPWRSALLDNIHVKANECSTPRLEVVQELLDSVTFKWDASPNAGSYTLQYAETGTTKWEEIPSFEGTSFGVRGLKPTTSYTVRVTPQCNNNMPAEVIFTTPLRLTVFEGFNRTDSLPKLWMQKWGFLDTNKANYTELFLSNYQNGATQWKFATPFVYIDNNSGAASINVTGTDCSAWMISPDIYLDATATIELSFKLGIASYSSSTSSNTVPATDTTVSLDDKFGIFISDDDHWRERDTLAFWDNTGKARSFKKIANTKDGERITIPIQGRKGRFKIAFFAESSVGNANNTIFVDSLLIRRPNVCEPVSELKVSDTLPFSAKATWTGDYYQNNYQIRWELQSNAAEKGNSFTSVPNKQMTNILPSKTYTVTTRGICGANDTSVWAQMVTFETPSNCSDVTNITSIPDSNSAVISWSKNGTNKEGYLYCYDTVGGKTVDQLTPEFTTDTTFEAADLTASTNYVVYVRPICTYEDTGSWSSYNFRTRNLACGVPAIPSISGITSTSATANWTAGYRSESYEFRYGSSATISAMSKVPTSNTTSIMSGLQPANTYYCVVRALCAYGDTSAFTEATDFITLQCTTVDSLKVNWNDNQTVATVTWRTKGGQNSWEVYLKSSDNSDNRYIVVNDSTYTINRSSLNASLGYEVEVRTVCGSSYSLYSAAETVKVSISNNELPEGVRISISPNPATDYVKLSIKGVEGNVKVELFSIAGQLINTEMLNCSLETTKELSLSGLAKGAYTIRLTHEKWSKTEKLIVK